MNRIDDTWVRLRASARDRREGDSEEKERRRCRVLPSWYETASENLFRYSVILLFASPMLIMYAIVAYRIKGFVCCFCRRSLETTLPHWLLPSFALSWKFRNVVVLVVLYYYLLNLVSWRNFSCFSFNNNKKLRGKHKLRAWILCSERCFIRLGFDHEDYIG